MGSRLVRPFESPTMMAMAWLTALAFQVFLRFRGLRFRASGFRGFQGLGG